MTRCVYHLSTHYAPIPFRFNQICIFWFGSYPRGRDNSVCACLRKSNSIYCLFTLWMCCHLISHWIIFHALGQPIKSYLKWTARNSRKNNNILKNSNYLTFTLALRPNAVTRTQHLLKRLHEWTRTELNFWKKNYFEKFAQGGPSFTWISFYSLSHYGDQSGFHFTSMLYLGVCERMKGVKRRQRSAATDGTSYASQ